MSISIHPIQMGLDRCYIIKDKGVIMIDGGFPKKLKDLLNGDADGHRDVVHSGLSAWRMVWDGLFKFIVG